MGRPSTGKLWPPSRDSTTRPPRPGISRKRQRASSYSRMCSGRITCSASSPATAPSSWGQNRRYYVTTSIAYGLQAGVLPFGYALFLMTDSALGRLDQSGGWQVGRDPGVVIMHTGSAPTPDGTMDTQGEPWTRRAGPWLAARPSVLTSTPSSWRDRSDDGVGVEGWGSTRSALATLNESQAGEGVPSQNGVALPICSRKARRSAPRLGTRSTGSSPPACGAATRWRRIPPAREAR